jgi:nicotinamidase-related amidase
MQRALLVIDMQNELVDSLPAQRRSELISAVGALVHRARARGTPVVYVRHNDDGPLRLGTPPWEIAAEVAPRNGEPIVEKQHADAFVETGLTEVFSVRKIDELVVCGMQSDFCVDATIRGALERGYRVTLAEDAHATYADGGKTEREIIDELHRELRGRSVSLSAVDAVHFEQPWPM